MFVAAVSFIFLIICCIISGLILLLFLTTIASKFLKGGGSLSKAAITTRIIDFPRALAVIHSFLTHRELDESSDHNMSATSCLDSALAISFDQSVSILDLSRHTLKPSCSKYS